MARVRTFIAVDLSKGVKARLKTLQENLSGEATGVRWAPPENFHLTLLFLGEVERLDVVPICKAVAARARKHSPFSYDIEGLGAFPNSRRPKVLWAGVTDGAGELKAIHDDLEEGLLELGNFRREDRGFTPHLTLGRSTKSDKAEELGTLLAKHGDFLGGTSHVTEVLVMSSDLKRNDTQYSVLGRAPLKG